MPAKSTLRLNGLFCLLCMVFFLPMADGQALVWAQSTGAVGDEAATAIVEDSNHNIVICGTFEGTVDFDPGSGVSNQNSNGLTDIFVTKRDGQGNHLWTITVGGSVDDDVFDLSVDALGNVLIVGNIAAGQSIDFDPGAGVANLTSNGASDFYVAKYDANGNYLWAWSLGGSANEGGYQVKTDPANNLYVAGTFGDSIDFDPGTASTYLSAQNPSDFFLAKYNSAGDFIWARQLSGPLSDDLTVDDMGNAYFAGTFGGTVDFDAGPGVYNLTSGGSLDVYFAKYSPNGNLLWANCISTPLQDAGGALAVDTMHNVYLAATYQGVADFDPSAGVMNVNPIGAYDVGIAKYDPAGALLWAFGVGSSNNDRVKDICLDTRGFAYVAGNLGGDLDADPGAGLGLVPSADGPSFMAKYDPAGQYVSSCAWGGIPAGIVVDSLFNLYAYGDFTMAEDFDPHPIDSLILSPVGASDLALAKYFQCDSVLAGPDLFWCDTTSGILMAAPLAIGQGNWTVVGGSGTVVSPMQSVTAINGLVLDAPTTFRWTVTGNGTCPNSFDDMVVTSSSVPTAATAGPDIAICGSSSTVLGGNVPTNGTGLWTILSGPGSLFNSSQANTPLQGLLHNNPVTLVWQTMNGSCFSTDTLNVITRPLPLVSAGLDEFLCDGDSVALSGSGAINYSWSNSIVDGQFFTPTIGATTYHLIGSDSFGCAAADSVLVSVYALPSVTAGNDTAVCDTGMVTLSGSGAQTYQWNLGVINGQAFMPAASATYVLIGTDVNGCSGTDSVQVHVGTSPNVSAGADFTACENDSITLSGTGAQSYQWNLGVTDGQAFLPHLGTLIYAVVGTDSIGCTGFDQVTVLTYPPPAVGLGADTTLCENWGNFVIDAGPGYASYLWSDNSTGQIITLNQTGDYWVEISDQNGCRNRDTVSVFFDPCLGLSDEQAPTIELYPNPSNGVIQITCLAIEPASVRLFSLDGRLLRSDQLMLPASLNLQSIPAGHYHLEITTGAQRVVKPLVLSAH